MKIEQVKNLVANLYEKTDYIIHIRNLKQVSSDGLFLKNLHRILEFKQKTWLKSYIGMNTHLRKKSKKWFWTMIFWS